LCAEILDPEFQSHVSSTTAYEPDQPSLPEKELAPRPPDSRTPDCWNAGTIYLQQNASRIVEFRESEGSVHSCPPEDVFLVFERSKKKQSDSL
jgi:hypothetical protein